MFEILNKWHPDSNQSVFQHYFYQNVGAERAPYFGVPEGEDPRKWEEALQKKPSDGSIPVLAKGFGEAGIAGRITTQDAAVKALYERVREIDKSLRDRIEEHDLTFTVRTQEARRKHLALSRRCLGLATKVQVLRNRGYALDSAEEELKDKLAKLEKVTFDHVLKGRQEELWARMTVVRERAKMLKEETERLGKKAGAGDEESIDEETMAKIKQVSLRVLGGFGPLFHETNDAPDLDIVRCPTCIFTQGSRYDQEGLRRLGCSHKTRGCNSVVQNVRVWVKVGDQKLHGRRSMELDYRDNKVV